MYNNKALISMGVEVEFYTINIPKLEIHRKIIYPKKSVIEKGERFTKDKSIGSEYDSKVFYSLHEALFLLKNGLRKYLLKNYRYTEEENSEVLALVGGWKDRFAGAHLHIGLGENGINKKDAEKLAIHIHDHIPFIIALSANSPIWREKITNNASNRLIRCSENYCSIVPRGKLNMDHYNEISYNYAIKSKPPTIELRVCDSNIPSYLCASLLILKLITLGWLKGKRITNKCSYENYVKARLNAARKGAKAIIFWNDKPVDVKNYCNLFFKKYKEELDEVNIPDEVLEVIKLFKKGWNGAEIIRNSCKKFKKKHPISWQKYFAMNYVNAIESSLNGETIFDFSEKLMVELPKINGIEIFPS
jgi:gamma-glutamyl:cysteine ligase YbdK (ATP-grasp superfamily)